MKELFQTYLQNSISLSVIGIMFLVLSPLFSRRYSAKCCYSLWLIVLFALIFPVRPQISIPVPGIMAPLVSDAGNLIGIGHGNGSSLSMVKALDFWQITALLWAGGAFCFLLWYSFNHFRFMSAVRRWSGDISHDKEERFHKVKAEMGIKREIAIRSCACIRTPMMAGFRKPVILFPKIDLSPDEFTFIIKHELVHYKRNDLYVRLLIMLALIIHWLNPIVHIMVRSALQLCEISCDEEVLKGTDSRIRARYGETIIGVIQKGKFYQTALSTNFYSGAKDMKKRIYAMMDLKRKRFSVLALCIVSFITFCGISAFALTAQSEQTVINPKLTASTNSGSSTKTSASSVSSDSSTNTAKDSEIGSRSNGISTQNKIVAAADNNPHLVARKPADSAASRGSYGKSGSSANTTKDSKNGSRDDGTVTQNKIIGSGNSNVTGKPADSAASHVTSKKSDVIVASH